MLVFEKSCAKECGHMNQRQEIAVRIKGLRESSGFSAKTIADKTGLSEEEYSGYESGNADVPMSYLSRLASFHRIDPTAILTGGDPHAKVYHLTRKGTGPVVERRAAYHYEGLATQYSGRTMEPFIVTVEAKKEAELHQNSHPGQEFNLVLEGRLRLVVDGHELELSAGDSIYFDSGKSHGMAALDGKAAKFLAIITD
jgi:mannose-6-phosphate isomerase-like protein (cupin superfamily)